MGIYGAQRAFFDPFARKFNFGATHFFKPYPFTSKFQSVSSASRGRPLFSALAPSLQGEMYISRKIILSRDKYNKEIRTCSYATWFTKKSTVSVSYNL